MPRIDLMKLRRPSLRHDRGYPLANKGHDARAIQQWLGHRSIASTAVYTALLPSANGEGSDFTWKNLTCVLLRQPK
jgi:integrase